MRPEGPCDGLATYLGCNPAITCMRQAPAPLTTMKGQVGIENGWNKNGGMTEGKRKEKKQREKEERKKVEKGDRNNGHITECKDRGKETFTQQNR